MQRSHSSRSLNPYPQEKQRASSPRRTRGKRALGFRSLAIVNCASAVRNVKLGSVFRGRLLAPERARQHHNPPSVPLGGSKGPRRPLHSPNAIRPWRLHFARALTREDAQNNAHVTAPIPTENTTGINKLLLILRVRVLYLSTFVSTFFLPKSSQREA